MAETNDEDTPPHGIRIAHIENRSLLAIVSDLIIDSVEHQRALKELAGAVRDSDKVVGSAFIKSLAEEIRRDATKRAGRAEEMDRLVENLRSNGGGSAPQP